MTTLQVLRKRYKSIQATEDMASAMKTAASVKYSRVSKILARIKAYSQACDRTLSLFGGEVLKRRTREVSTRNCLVVFTNSRGFCGGFNSELLRFLEQRLAEETETPLLFVFGQKGIQFCKDKGLEYREFPYAEIPEYADAEALTAKLFELYAGGSVNQVCFIFQHFVNMMQQVPVAEVILPHTREEAAESADLLFLPDRETALEAPAMYCLINSVYRLMLEHCAGIQAATNIAMRSACDNAEKSLEKLEIQINRIRQAEVTNSVIETSSYITGKYDQG